MKLVNTLYNLEFDLMENQILVLSIENHLAYRNILEELWKQYKGETGNFILSDGDKELKMSQRIECIYNIFNINTNDRKIISKLYQELTYQNDALLQEESIRFKQELMEYFDKLISTVPYNLTEKAESLTVTVFESFVNSERCKTLSSPLPQLPRFESFVNSERCKTMKCRRIF